ncbi:MAG: DUF5030 domain-containing protein [Paraprevotella sp.]|nr:DUF5030 domain-containing protein [Paraprevotella sp.]
MSDVFYVIKESVTHTENPVIRHQQGFWGMWVDYPQKVDSMFCEITDGRFYWNTEQIDGQSVMVLDSIAAPDRARATQMMEQLKLKYGVSPSGAALATWLDGQVAYLNLPRPYMTYMVSPWGRCMDIRRGVKESGDRLPRQDQSDYTREVAFYEHALYEDWGFTLYQEMLLFTHDVHRHIKRDPDFKGREEIDFLLTKEKNGTYGFRLLLPKEPTTRQKMLIKELRKAIKAIPYKLFTPMYTSDGRLLPGRYYHGEYSKEGWRFTDYLMVQENWEFLRKGSLPRQDRNWYTKFNILKSRRKEKY